MNPMSSGKTNGDIYVVASKVVPVKPVALVFSGGVRGTNAELWGMGGNAPNWQARAFGASHCVHGTRKEFDYLRLRGGATASPPLGARGVSS